MPRTGPPLSTAMLDAAVGLIGKTGRLGSVEVTGTSMLPTFDGVVRLAVEFAPSNPSFGDVLVFRQNGTLVVHRLVQRSRGNAGLRYRTRGDGKIAFDPWVEPDSVIGRVVALGYGDGTWRSVRSPAARCYGRALGLHGLAWGGLGAGVLKLMGPRGRDWRWQLGRLDFFKLRLAHGLFFRVSHPRIPAPDFHALRTGRESTEVEARCYTPAGKQPRRP